MKTTFLSLLLAALLSTSALSQSDTKPPAGFMEFSEGRLAFEAGRFDEALTLFDKAVTAAPTSHMFLTARAKARVAKGQYNAAFADIERSIKLFPEYDAFLIRAEINMRRDEFKSAAKDLDEAIVLAEAQMAEELPEYLVYRSQFHRESGNDSAADADLKKAAQLADADAKWMTDLGRHNHRDRFYGLAVAAFSAAIDVSPKYIEAHIGKAVTMGRLENYDVALEGLDQAHRIDPKNGVAYAVRANILRLQNKHELAIEAAGNALTLAGSDKPEGRRLAYEVRSLSFCALGKKADASKDETEFVKLGGKLATPCR